jgi:hypothetical protein
MSDDVPALVPPASANAIAFKHIRHPQKRTFLRVYAETGNMSQAFEKIGMHRDNHYHWMKKDQAYAEAFKTAQLMAGNKFEDEVYRRAFSGIDKPLVYQGQISKDKNGNAVTVKEYSDLLAIFALKGLFPDKYRDNRAGVSFQGPTQINITVKGDSPPQALITHDDKKDDE